VTGVDSVVDVIVEDLEAIEVDGTVEDLVALVEEIAVDSVVDGNVADLEIVEAVDLEGLVVETGAVSLQDVTANGKYHISNQGWHQHAPRMTGRAVN